MEKSRAIELLEHLAWDRDIESNPYGDALNMAIDALKAQPSCEGTTSDTISRQQAIDRFNVIRPVDPKKDEYTKGIDVGIAMCIVAVKDQPTIQPQSTMGQLNDGARSTNLIDRQQAIDGKIAIQRANGVEIYSDEAVPVEYLKNLPTIQPEPKEGHWIDKGWDGDWAWYADGRGNCWRVIECSECGKGVSVESNYCPHCGAYMRGEKNGKVDQRI